MEESWQKAAGIIPPHLCETGNTECGGDRYQDTGERGRWLAHFHSLSLSRGRGWPQLRAGAVSWHLVSFTVSPRIPHPGSNFSNERKSGGESYACVMSKTMCWRMCEKVSVCSHDNTHRAGQCLMTNTQSVWSQEEVGKPVARDDCMNWSAGWAIIILTV